MSSFIVGLDIVLVFFFCPVFCYLVGWLAVMRKREIAFLLLLLLKLQLLSRFVVRVAECPKVFLGLEGEKEGKTFFSFSTLCILEP